MHSLSKIFKNNLISSTSIIAVSLTAIASPAVAQDAQDEIIVTGSRIPQDPNLLSNVPVQSLDSDDFRISGEISLADVVNDVPALVSSLTSENSVSGANALNLRGLGANRTLTLVNGRRHVAGFEGSQAVDIGSIPQALIERVEVLTGGASAIYGADAVTGVVNFILKDDFEGVDVDVRAGVSDQGDGENFSIRALVGKNFDNDRGNVVLALDYIEDSVLRYGDRDFSRNNGVGDDLPNAAVRDDPNAPPRVFGRDPRFSISSGRGLLAFQDFGPSGLDVNNNGIEDCEESSVGRNWLAFGFGGCHVFNDDGSIRPFQDGQVGSSTNQFGGDGIANNHDLDTLFPSVDTVNLNLNASYDLNNNHEVFIEGKYSTSTASTFAELNGFFDLLPIATDNPFIPASLQATANNAGGLYVNRDPRDLVTGEFDTTERETIRIVGGLKGTFENGWNYEVSGNYGEFSADFNDENFLVLDRFFAAIDVVSDATGNPVCRSTLDPTATPPGTPFGIPAFDEGIFTFTPGDGQCQPLNVLGGTFSASPEALDFVLERVTDRAKIKQTVFSAIISGDSEDYFTLPAGAIGFAAGVEYRDEQSKNTINPFDQGILPQGTPFTPGALVSTVSTNESLGFNGGTSRTQNSVGNYDVFDVFGEIRVPLVADKPFFKNLTVDAAVRIADYSTLGSATTWKVGGNWTVDDNLSFRGTFSEAIRAPNITELFSPEQPIFVRPNDPCDSTIVPTAPDPALRAANCAADGIPADFRDPLTARFPGTSGGNPDLTVETADTYTIGGVLTPSFIDNFSLTVDYWNVQLVDAIGSLTSQNIVDNCYDLSDFPNDFCALFTRINDPASPQNLGLNSIQTNSLNFAQAEAAGVDFAANYRFDVSDYEIGLNAVGTRQIKLDNFFNPANLTDVNPALGEIQTPKWSGNATVSVSRGPWDVAVQGSYQSRQTLTDAEIETVVATFGPDNGFANESYIFDANASYQFSDSFTFYGGVNNITGTNPFLTETAWPAGPRGRFFFAGVRYRM